MQVSREKACTIWFTGLPSSGKSTLAEMLEKELRRRGRYVEILDGDVVRTHLSKGLGFNREDRDTNIRRIGFVCHLLTRNDVFAISAAISPYRNIRDENRAMIGNFVEVYVRCSLEECVKRDVKGLYKKALAGEIKEFTGISDPYEEPLNPEITVDTLEEEPADSLRKILNGLIELGYLKADASDNGRTEATKVAGVEATV
ncbi:MAG TPA: adenylyl-sulfate kinase [bacterium]